MKYLLALLLLPAFASAQSLRVQKLNAKKTRFSASYTGTAPSVGEIYAWTNTQGRVCNARVTKVDSDRVLLSTQDCPAAAQLKAGERFSLVDIDSFTPVPSVVAAKKAPKNIDRLGVGGVFSMANEMGYSLNLNNGNFTAKDSSAGALGLSASYHRLSPGRFGWNAFLTYELEREISTTSVNGANFVYNTKPTLSLLILEASGNYAFGDAYIYAGVNYPIVTNYTSEIIDLKPDIGFQLGGGYLFPTAIGDIGADLKMRFVRATGSYSNITDVGSVSDAKIDGFVLSAYYFFDQWLW